MNIVIVSDSLGMPRENIHITKVWTYMLTEKMKAENNIFIFPKRGLSIIDIYNMKDDLFHLYKPDVVIFQFGIVDCLRRAMPRLFLKTVMKLPVISHIINNFAKKHHYFLTRLHEDRMLSEKIFFKYLKLILNELQSKNIKVLFIRIADCGEKLKQETYNAENDINLYNSKIKEEIKNYKNVQYINPYESIDSNKYILDEDGHHLNEYGNKLVLCKVYNTIELL